jgi:hypothetical protein
MFAVALAVAALSTSADEAPAPPPPRQEAVEELPGESAAWPARRSPGSLLFAAGAGGLSGGGVSPTASVALDLRPADNLGLRVQLGFALGSGWGAAELAPQLLLRTGGVGVRLAPYLALGGQISALNVVSGGPGASTSSQPLSTAARSRKLVPVGDVGGTGGPAGPLPPTPFRFSFGPQAAGGILLPLARDLILDASLRYDLRWFAGSFRNGVAAILVLSAPL